MNYIYSTEQKILDIIEIQHGIGTRRKIENLPVENKRIAMFAAISSKKNSELRDMLKELTSEEQIIKQLDKIIERFRKYVPIGKVEKKSFGEVFTPFKLVNEMLDTLPEEVWSNPYLKWANLCNGMGNFMIIIVKRLMIGLRQWEANEAKRYKHIIENMIYVGELQAKNMFLWMLSVDPKSKLKLNIYTGDTLSIEFDKFMKEEWKIEKFDIIVGNPPYQDGKLEGNNKIYPAFSKKFINLLKYDGSILFITPVSATKNNQRFSLIGQKGLKQVNFTANKKFDNVGVDICYWYIDKKYEGNVFVIDDNCESYQSSDEQIFDYSKHDKSIINIIQNIKKITLKNIENRMFRQNNFQPDVKKNKDFEYKTVIFSKKDEIYGYIKATPYHNEKLKIVIPFTKNINENVILTTDNFNQNWVCTDIKNEDEYDHIKSFILSESFKNFDKQWKKMDGYGFSNSIKYIPVFDKTKKWNNKDVKEFLEKYDT